MSKYNRKQKDTAQGQDEFVSFWAKAFQKVEPYLRFIGFTMIGTLVVLFGFWAVTSWMEGRSQNAAEMFGRAVKVYEADLYTGDTPPKPPEGEANPIPRFKTEKERGDATLMELDKLDKTYGSTDVARQALLFRAGVLFDMGRYDDAYNAYEKLLAARPKSPAVQVLAKEGAALCDEARGRLDDALSKYKTLVPEGKAGDFYRDRALYGQARIHLRKGEKAKAAEALKEALTKVPNTALKDEIQARIAQIEDK
jgi:tetratricopeptide (TPR) repeat protein